MNLDISLNTLYLLDAKNVRNKYSHSRVYFTHTTQGIILEFKEEE